MVKVRSLLMRSKGTHVVNSQILEALTGIGSVVVIYTGRIIELRTKRETIAGIVKENLTLRLFVAIGTALLAGAIVEFSLRGFYLRPALFVLGWLAAIASFQVRREAIRALGRFWSLHVEIRDGHEFVRSGPFRWVRHPTYLSMILELVAIGFILDAFVSLAIALLAFGPTLAARIKLEEAALVEKFGAPYIDYQKSTPLLFPYRFWSSRA
jgi:protein-S-isoprenylcysteine O-methyltransferase Ste14